MESTFFDAIRSKASHRAERYAARKFLLPALAGLLWMVLPQLAPAQSLYYLYNGG